VNVCSVVAKSLYLRWLHCNYMRAMQIRMKGYEAVEKVAQAGGNSARIYVPKHWQGKKVKVVLVEE